jgi:hypothetical protein
VHMKTSGSHSTLKAGKSVMIKVWKLTMFFNSCIVTRCGNEVLTTPFTCFGDSLWAYLKIGDLNFPIPIVWFTYILKILWSYSCIFVCSCAVMCAISQSNGTQSRWSFCGWCTSSRSDAVSAVSSVVVLSLLPGLEGFGVSAETWRPRVRESIQLEELTCPAWGSGTM